MRQLPVLAMLIVLAACNPQADGGEITGNPDTSGASPAAPEPAQSGKAPVLSASGWLVVGEDGLVYTTMLDPDGTYRDFRDGQPLQDGAWRRGNGGNLCFIPAAEDRNGECWTLGRLKANGSMRATSASGRVVVLRRIAYAPATVADGVNPSESLPPAASPEQPVP